MDAWIGLIGALAGAAIAWSGQYLTRRSEARERQDALLLEQCALIVALEEDLRNRIWEERHKIATGVVTAWDLGAQRLAQARLRIIRVSKPPRTGIAVQIAISASAGSARAWNSR